MEQDTLIHRRIGELEEQLVETQSLFDAQSRTLKYHQTLLDNAPFDVSFKDLDGCYVLTNRAFEAHVGKHRDEIIGRRLSDLVESAHASPFSSIEKKVVARDHVYEEEVMTPAVDGLRPFRSVKFPIHDDEGAIVGVGTISNDLSTVKEAEAAAARAHTNLADAIEALPDGIVLFDADDRLVFCNAKYHELHAAVADVMVPGVHIEEIVRTAMSRGQHPDADGREEEWVQERLAAFRNPGRPIEQQLGDGNWLRVYERRTKDGGTVGVRVDITELKERERELSESEQRLRDYLDASSDWYWEMDEECRFSYFSDRFEEVTGVPPAMLMGKTRQETGVPGVDPLQCRGLRQNQGPQLFGKHSPLSPQFVEKALSRFFVWVSSDSYSEIHPVKQSILCQLRLLEIMPLSSYSRLVSVIFSHYFLTRTDHLLPTYDEHEMALYEEALVEALDFSTDSLVELHLGACLRSYDRVLGRPA